MDDGRAGVCVCAGVADGDSMGAAEEEAAATVLVASGSAVLRPGRGGRRDRRSSANVGIVGVVRESVVGLGLGDEAVTGASRESVVVGGVRPVREASER